MRQLPRMQVDHIGAEKCPVIVIDNFVADPEALRAEAAQLRYAKMGAYYPGVRALVPDARVAEYMPDIVDLIASVFGFSRNVALVNAMYSLVTTPRSELAVIQRLPHYDGFEAENIALLHYLSPPGNSSGTAFYRHRSTGYEYVDQQRYAPYSAALERDVAQHGLPPPDYIVGETPIFEQTYAYEPKFNRALIYRGHMLHSGNIPEDLILSDDPRVGRLTANTFLRGEN